MTSRKGDNLLALLARSSIWKFISKVYPSRLTVLNYHRIEDPEGEKSLFKPNISATPEMFVQQLDYLCKNFNVISVSQLVDWLSGKAILPPNSALITFDDGYLDNYTNAFPQLKMRQLPAVIFLATGFIGQSKLFYWDLIAYSFKHTEKNNLSITNFGQWSWKKQQEHDLVAKNVIDKLKTYADEDKNTIIEGILKELEISISEDTFPNLFVNWDQVRALTDGMIEMGAHTVNHPILTRVPLDIAVQEMMQSKQMIERNINREVVSLAYPNGQSNDFNPLIIQEVKKLGFEVAFTLLSGPQNYRNVLKNPLAIRRVFLSYRDTLPRFLAKIYGFPRVLEEFGRDLG